MYKILIFDSSSIINFSMNGMLDILVKLKKIFNGKFIMPEAVKSETIDTPMKIKKFELAAIKIKALLDEGIFELPEVLNCPGYEIKDETSRILSLANNSFKAKQEFLHLIDKGEASCLACALLCSKKGIKSAVVVDERTTRLLGEKPLNLKELLERKLHTKVEMKGNFDFLRNISFIRSSELAYVAWKKGLVELKNPSTLDALLYAVKFKGATISRQEIEEIKRIG